MQTLLYSFFFAICILKLYPIVKYHFWLLVLSWVECIHIHLQHHTQHILILFLTNHIRMDSYLLNPQRRGQIEIINWERKLCWSWLLYPFCEMSVEWRCSERLPQWNTTTRDLILLFPLTTHQWRWEYIPLFYLVLIYFLIHSNI